MLSVEAVLFSALVLEAHFARRTDPDEDKYPSPIQPNNKFSFVNSHYYRIVSSYKCNRIENRRFTCSKDLRPASFPHASISSNINFLTSGLAHRTLSVPGIPFSTAQHLITSTSGTTIAIIQDFNDSPWTNTCCTYWLRI